MKCWCYHIPVSSSPVDFMKADRKKFFFQLLLNCVLLIGFVLSGVVSYSLCNHPDCTIHTENLFRISLANSILLFVIFAVANYLFVKLHKNPLDTQHIDMLTGCMTRHAFSNVFRHVLLDTNRTLEPLSVIIIDIDHFKIINENHGYQTGDELLTILSTLIQSVLRASDRTCRWDGDQIFIILKDCQTRDACRVARKLLDKIRGQHLLSSGKSITFTTSIGIAQMISTDNTESLATRAETGLHSARDSGRNTCAIGYDWILIDYCYEPILLPA